MIDSVALPRSTADSSAIKFLTTSCFSVIVLYALLSLESVLGLASHDRTAPSLFSTHHRSCFLELGFLTVSSILLKHGLSLNHNWSRFDYLHRGYSSVALFQWTVLQLPSTHYLDCRKLVTFNADHNPYPCDSWLNRGSRLLNDQCHLRLNA